MNIIGNIKQVTQAIKDHRNDQYFHCLFLFGWPSFGITYTLSNHPWFNDGKILSQFTFGKWPD